MATEFVQAGYIEVWRDGEVVSRHRVEREAVESALADSENRGSGEYELRFPSVRIIVKRKITQPNAPALGVVSTTGATTLSVSLDRPASGPTQLSEYVLERRVYNTASFTEIARGIAIFGVTNAYADTGLSADTQYEYRCKAIDTTARESEWSAPAIGTTASLAELYEPTNVSAVSISGGIRVSWSPPSTGLQPTSYEVQRTYAADGEWSVKTTQAGTTYEDTDVSEGQPKWYRIVSINGVNRSVPSSVVTAVGGPSATADSKKWHPGHYVKTQGDHSQTDQAAYLAAVQNTFAKSLDNSTLKGNYATLAWGAVNTTGSTFTGSAIDSWLAWHETNNRRLILEISYKNFRPNVGILAPADLIASGDVIKTLTGWIAAVWRPAVMDRLIATYQWLASQYDAELRLEMVSSAESAPSLSTAQAPDYSQAALHTQLQRLIAACGTSFTRTTTIIPQINNLGTYPPQLIEGAYQAGGGFGSPDCRPTSESILIFAGETVDGIGTGLRDYRGQMANHQIASASALNEFTGDMAGLIDFAQQYSVTHLSWVTSSTTPGQTWAEIKSAIASDPDLYTACPIIYSGGCDVG